MKPKIVTYGVIPQKKAQEIAKKFDWRKWKLQIFLVCLLAIGGLFNLFALESEDRYEDLKVNEEQKAILESSEETVGDMVGIAGSITSIISMVFPLMVGIIVVSVILQVFMGRRR